MFSTAAIRNIRRNFPDSFIACVVPGRCYPVLKGNPYLDEVVIFDERDRDRGIMAKIDFIRLLRLKDFDTVFLLHRSFSRALICFLAGIPERIGYATKKRTLLLTKKITPSHPDSMHRIDYYLNIIERSGLRAEDRFLEFFTSEEDLDFVDGFLKNNGIGADEFLVGINPGGNWPPKRWPNVYWARLADSLIDEFGVKVIITGSSQDIKDASEISRGMKHKPIVACGALNLKQLGALCKRLGLFITADTGPLHIANAVGAKKIIALFGPTSVNITGPYPAANVVILQKEVGCKIPCYQLNCQDNRCMKAISVEDVLNEARKIIQGSQ